jgi:hypothetical protein
MNQRLNALPAIFPAQCALGGVRAISAHPICSWMEFAAYLERRSPIGERCTQGVLRGLIVARAGRAGKECLDLESVGSCCFTRTLVGADPLRTLRHRFLCLLLPLVIFSKGRVISVRFFTVNGVDRVLKLRPLGISDPSPSPLRRSGSLTFKYSSKDPLFFFTRSPSPLTLRVATPILTRGSAHTLG